MSSSQRLWPISDSLFALCSFDHETAGKRFQPKSQNKVSLFLIGLNILEAGDNQFSSSPSKESKGQVLGGIMEGLWGKQPAPPSALSETSPAFFPKPLVGVLGSEPPWLAVWGAHCTVYQQAESLKCQTLFIDLTILLSPTSHGKSNTFLYGLILVILHNVHPEITQALFVFSLSKQTCLF